MKAILMILLTGMLADIPVGARVHVRLLTAVSSSAAKPGDAVDAIVIAGPLARTVFHGRVTEAQQNANDRRAMLKLEFKEARVIEVDNARETTDESGRILGILAAETLAGVLRTAGIILTRDADPAITYPVGTELTLQLTRAVPATNPPVGEPQSPAADLAEVVQALPLRTMTERPTLPSDLTNVVFIGTREELEQAFKSAGWFTARQLDAASVIETAIAIIESRGYHEAPVSRLLLEGRHPDMVFQKTTNTFSKRHHVRVWDLHRTYHGQPMWIGAATHDSGIAFAVDERAFYHTIDARIDEEREKIVNDLVFEGRGERLGRIDRPRAPREAQNATGNRMVTDGAVAVVRVGGKVSQSGEGPTLPKVLKN